LQSLKKQADEVLSGLDLILTPTIGAQFTVAQVLADPVRKNDKLGYYTNFMNLLDYAAIAIPAGQTGVGVPWGVTLFAPAWRDQKLLAWVTAWQRATQQQLGALDLRPYSRELPIYKDIAHVDLVVCGAHLRDQPLNWQLSERRGVLVRPAKTSERYRLYVLADGKRPALVRKPAGGAAIEVEIWRLPAAEFAGFVADIPPPLGIGKVELEDSQWYNGFICEPAALSDASDITHLGGWRQYLAQVC
jgi:allophanate hydrolase